MEKEVAACPIPLGSPPHPRGILIISGRMARKVRFTPASAGNILNRLITYLPLKVHPRIRGEYFLGMAFKGDVRRFTPASAGNIQIRTYFHLGIKGSPPHPRGIYRNELLKSGAIGFTPASAGNIRHIIKIPDQFEVHPHIRGEYALTYKTN